MTSRTGPKRTPGCSGVERRRTTDQAAEPPRTRRGFTLLEILLVFVIFVLMAGIVVVNFPALAGSQSLEEASLRMETALRMARADAANKGLRLQLRFDQEEGRVTVLWEPQPLAEPGEFVEYTSCTWQKFLQVEGIVVERCEFVGASAYRRLEDATVAGGYASDPDQTAVTFEPDGSSDSVVIELVAAEMPEGLRARVELEGLTGAVRRRVLTLEELEELGAY
jgi:prepilin-type N-terminal cleavage/methylation domain-containing protein